MGMVLFKGKVLNVLCVWMYLFKDLRILDVWFDCFFLDLFKDLRIVGVFGVWLKDLGFVSFQEKACLVVMIK